MPPLPAVSLILVSRHRSAALLRALTAVAQMDHPEFEVIVVADPAAAAAVRAGGWPVRMVEFDEANISAARNLGLGLAAAPVVAFLDDDAVPEPTWLSRLAAPFHDPDVTQAGGYVRGRSGLGWQWRAMRVDRRGFDHPFDPGPGVSLHRGDAGVAIKTQGTNCAFRRADLIAAGGFDPAFRFYLDEADVNLRLAASGGLSAVVPGAVVHHGYAASDRRRADRTPTDLTEIGASIAAFLRRHAPDDEGAAAAHLAVQRARLIGLMVAGALEPRDVSRLMAGLRAGMEAGRRRELRAARALPALPPSPFSPMPQSGARPGLVLQGRDLDQLRREAAGRVADGHIVTLFALRRGFRAQIQQFHPGGWWEVTGGRFGKAHRDHPAPRFAAPSARIAQTIALLAGTRPVR
ncbi:glycosyltransferase family 2 protein [Szabonella alba]|uniref:Glycosyltransferase n=1 Tax=Szabonella alba TaxID=2804194 RepID=A0A8K0VB51_9RHOB|nr:glycosyltransferase [Szabonella alba]MBL4916529.1 glycosyltransferase [Szabonella alba]